MATLLSYLPFAKLKCEHCLASLLFDVSTSSRKVIIATLSVFLVFVVQHKFQDFVRYVYFSHIILSHQTISLPEMMEEEI